MYEVKNLRPRQTTIALPGKGITLTKRGSKGSTALILDSEKDHDAVQALVKIKAIRLDRAPGGESAPAPEVAAELQRIKATHEAHERAAVRAEGKVPPPRAVNAERTATDAKPTAKVTKKKEG